MPRYRHAMTFGAALLDGGGVRFRLYAPNDDTVELVYDPGTGDRRVPMQHLGGGLHERIADDARAGTRYRFAVGEALVPDPASRFAPEGPHGPSVVVDPRAFDWPDADRVRPWNEFVIYELHVGTFTREGTYAAAIAKLDDLRDLGITALELMPLAEAPGARNWGYDGVLPFAPSHNYGTPDELKALVAAAHARGIAIMLDVVYNHFGPEANYLHGYAGTFYTDRFHTPWGSAIDVVDDDRQTVRDFFIENAVYWLQEYRFDGLRFDAVHEIYDRPERRFMREMAARIASACDRDVYLVLENEANEASLLAAGYRAQWADDAHNATHVLVTGQKDGYYADFADRPAQHLARSLSEGFAYQGEATHVKGEPRGEPSARVELASFVTFLQNHDQVGNRPFGDRLTSQIEPEAVRAAAATLLLAPTTPLIFMGEEWGATTPFLFFCDFEPELARLVTEGRRNEFRGFAAFADPAARERIPDPSSAEAFERSKLRWEERASEPHAAWLAFYRELLRIRREHVAPLVAEVRGTDARASVVGECGLRIRWAVAGGAELALDANLGPEPLRGFDAAPGGRVLFATHPPAYDDGTAPAWSVRWSLA